jgi:hypothetical protein
MNEGRAITRRELFGKFQIQAEKKELPAEVMAKGIDLASPHSTESAYWAFGAAIAYSFISRRTEFLKKMRRNQKPLYQQQIVTILNKMKF